MELRTSSDGTCLKICIRPRAIGSDQFAHVKAFMPQENGRGCIKMYHVITPTLTLYIRHGRQKNICIGYSRLGVGKHIYLFDRSLVEQYMSWYRAFRQRLDIATPSSRLVQCNPSNLINQTRPNISESRYSSTNRPVI